MWFCICVLTPDPLAKFIVPDREDVVDAGIRLSYRLLVYIVYASLHIGRRVGTTALSGVNFIPPVRDYAFGYRTYGGYHRFTGVVG